MKYISFIHRTRRDRDVPGNVTGESQKIRKQIGGTSNFTRLCESTE
jgi:hypothetical protein